MITATVPIHIQAFLDQVKQANTLSGRSKTSFTQQDEASAVVERTLRVCLVLGEISPRLCSFLVSLSWDLRWQDFYLLMGKSLIGSPCWRYYYYKKISGDSTSRNRGDALLCAHFY